MTFIAMIIGIIIASIGAQKLYDKGFKAGWLALTVIGFTTWIVSLAYQFTQWGVK